MSTRNIFWEVEACRPYYLHVSIVLEYESLSLLEPSGPVQDCNRIALPLPFVCAIKSFFKESMSYRLYVSKSVHKSASSCCCALRCCVTLASLCWIQFIGYFLPKLSYPPLLMSSSLYFFVVSLCLLNYILLTYLLTPWCRVLLEKLTGLQLVKKFPTFHGTRRFITALTSVRRLSLSWASPIQSIYPHPTSWRSILILSTHLGLGLPSGLFPSGFPTKTLYTPSPHPYAPHAQPISFLLLCVLITNV